MDKKHQEKWRQLSLNIAYYRKKRGYTQEVLAEMVDISRTHISNIEARNVEVFPSLEVLFNIADALQVSVAALFEQR